MTHKNQRFSEPRDYRYRAFIGPADKYDLTSALQFNLLTFLGLREEHFLLDVGCGSLAGGRLFIPYLLPGRYYGIEPFQWLVEEGIKNELGNDIILIKRPVFNNNNEFILSIFNRKFDFILAQSIFSHASQRQIRRCLSEAGKVMKPTSFFVATFVEGEENYAGDEWVYPGFVTYTLDFIKIMFENNGLICESIDWPHPTSQKWLVATTRANSRNEMNTHFNDKVNNLSRLEKEVKRYKSRLEQIRENY